MGHPVQLHTCIHKFKTQFTFEAIKYFIKYFTYNLGEKCDGSGSCCTSSNQCDIGEGDCDENSNCIGYLVCGTSNCHGVNVNPHNDCCELGKFINLEHFQFFQHIMKITQTSE